jgi:hypothetical protein
MTIVMEMNQHRQQFSLIAIERHRPALEIPLGLELAARLARPVAPIPLRVTNQSGSSSATGACTSPSSSFC